MNEVKFYEGNIQRSTPTFEDVGNYLRTKSNKIKLEKLPCSQVRNYDQLSISVDSPNCSTNKAQQPYSDLLKLQSQKMHYIHERKASNMTQPKENEHESLRYHYDLTTRIPQSEQKSRFYHKIKKSRSKTKRHLNFDSKERIPIDIKTGGKDLGVPEKSTLLKNSIKVESSIKGRIKKPHK